MLKLQIALCVVLAFALSAFAQQAPTPEQLLDAIHKNADLSAAGPYTLTATVTGKQSGELRIDRDHDRFRVQLDLPGYREVRLTLGDKTYIPRTQVTLLATGLADFDHIWDPLWRPPGSKPLKARYKKPARKSIRGIEALCFDEKEKSGKTRLCIDPARSVLLSSDAGRYGKTEYARYNSFSGHLVPGRVEIHRPNIQSLVLEDIHVQFHALEAARFAIPEHSIELETCEGIQLPRPVFTPPPAFGLGPRTRFARESVTLNVLIDADGGIAEAEVLNPTGDKIEVDAINTVRTWKFKPATCGGHAVASEMMVELAVNVH